MEIQWNEEKAESIKNDKSRNIDMDKVAAIILAGDSKMHFKHPNQDKYPNQYVHIIDYDGVPIFVPYVPTENGIFIKNAIPNRKFKKYI